MCSRPMSARPCAAGIDREPTSRRPRGRGRGESAGVARVTRGHQLTEARALVAARARARDAEPTLRGRLEPWSSRAHAARARAGLRWGGSQADGDARLGVLDDALQRRIGHDGRAVLGALVVIVLERRDVALAELG